MRLQSVVHEDTCPSLTRHLLQWQGDQVTEPTFGQGVLVRKQAIVRAQRQLPRTGAGVAYERRPQAARIAGGDTASKENPGMGAIAGARNFQRDRNIQLTTGVDEGSGIITPVRFVEIHGKQMAIIACQQRIKADGMPSRQVIEQNLIGQWQQLPLLAVTAFDARLFADTWTPLVRTGRGVAAFASLAFPADWINVGAPPEQLAKERDFLVCGQR